MRADIRRRLVMAEQALAFMQAHPSTDVSLTAVVTRLQDRLTRSDVLALQQHNGDLNEQGSVARHNQLRTKLQQEIHHLVRVAAAAEQADPTLTGQFLMPNNRGPHRTFIVTTEALITAATTHKDALIAAGLGDTMLDEITADLAEFDQLGTTATTARQDHVGARADLESVCHDCMQLVGLLDGLNRNRFNGNPEMLAAWQSARTVLDNHHLTHDDPPVVPTPVTPPAPAPAPAPGSDNGSNRVA